MKYKIVARNSAPDSRNRIHSDEVAREYGFRGGLVPGVAVYGYMTGLLGLDWMERGSIKARFLKPVCEGDQLDIVVESDEISVHRGDELSAVATVGDAVVPPHRTPTLQSLNVTLEPTRLSQMLDPLPLPDIAHPAALLELANQILMANYELGPWLHVGSDVTNRSLAHWGDMVTLNGVVHEEFEKKGHEFRVVDLWLRTGERLLQSVRHTAIVRLRPQK